MSAQRTQVGGLESVFSAWRAEGGSAMIEFAIVAPVLVILILGMAEVALYLLRSLQLNAALESGVIYVASKVSPEGWTDSNPNTAANIAQAVTGSTSSGGAISVTNQGFGMCTYRCLINGKVDLTTGTTCTDGNGRANFYSCSSGVLGKYITISARMTGQAIFSRDFLGVYPITQTVSVKVQ